MATDRRWDRRRTPRPDPATLRRIEGAVRAEARRLYGTGDAGAAAPTPTSARRRRPGRLVVLGAAGALALGGAAGATILLQGGDGSVVLDPAAAPALRESADLNRAPWLFQPDGSPHIATVAPARSLAFPPGTTYREAVTRLVLGVVAEGTIPADARLVDPLPAGVVWQRAASGASPVLSLVAPLGYSVPQGLIRVPSYSFAPGVSIDEAHAILVRSRRGSPVGAAALRGVSVDVPALDRCQVGPPGGSPPACRLDPPPTTRPGS